MDPKDLADAATKLGTEIIKPVYEDGAQPVVRELGQALGVAGSLVRLVVRPVGSVTIFGHTFFDRVDGWLRERAAGRPRNTPVQEAAPNVAGPLLLNLAFSQDVDELRKLYVELLGKATEVESASSVHPAFADVIRGLSPQEATCLKELVERGDHPALIVRAKDNHASGFHLEAMASVGTTTLGLQAGEAFIANLVRLGICELDRSFQILVDEPYDRLTEIPDMVEFRAAIERTGFVPVEDRALLRVTGFGASFLFACLPGLTRGTVEEQLKVRAQHMAAAEAKNSSK